MRTLFIIPLVLFLTSCMSTGVDSPTTSTKFEYSTVSSQITSKPDLTSLDSETQSQINILCQDEYFEGTVPYWNCLDKELTRVQGVPKPDLSYLDSDVRSQINILCQDEYFDGTIEHRKCLGKELKKIDGLTRPDIGSVDSGIQSQVRIVCQDDYFNETIGYWNCLRTELKKIGVTPPEIPISTKQTVQSTPTISQDTQSVVEEPVVEEPVFTSKPDMSGLNELDVIVIETRCERSKIRGIQDYWGCIQEQIDETKVVNFPNLYDVDEETREVMITSCQFRIIRGIKNFYGCLNDQLKSIGK